MSRDTLKKYGAEGAIEYPRFTPGGSDKILSVLDKGHFMHGKVNAHRYDIEGDSVFAARNLALIEDIKEHGVEQPGVIWWHNDVGHIISGTRRWTMLEAANGLRKADDLDPFSMKFEVNSRWSEAVAAEKWRRANQGAVQNDLLTRLEGAALDIERGVDPERVAEVWEFSPAQLKRALDPAHGILVASEELRTALATGEIKLSAALKLAPLSRDEQRVHLSGAAITLKVESGKPSAVSMTKLHRLRDEIRGNKLYDGMTALDLLAILAGESAGESVGRVAETTFASALAEPLRAILSEKSKPGRKPKESP